MNFSLVRLGRRWINWPLSTRTEGLVPDVDEGLGWSSEEVRRRLVNTDQALPLCSHGVTYGTGNTAVISEIVSSSIQTERTAVPAPRTVPSTVPSPWPASHQRNSLLFKMVDLNF